MKQIFMINLIAIAMCLFSCSNSKKQANVDPSVVQAEVEANAGVKPFILTEDGVGSLRMKHPFKNMSDTDEGLYNKVEKGTFYYEPAAMKLQTYTLYCDDVEVANFMLEKQLSPIEELTVTSPYVSLENGVKVGMPLREAVTKKGMEAMIMYDEMFDQGIVYIAYGKNLRINVVNEELDDLTEQTKMKALAMTANGDLAKTSELEGKSIQLTPEDFKPEAKVACFYIDRRFEE